MNTERRKRNTRKHAPARVSLAPHAIPRATYRVQLHSDFRFTDATALVPYLAALGISHLYCSPYLKARPGSRHGYDIVEHAMLNPEIGSREDFDLLVDTLARHGMSHLCDVVPNHMAIMGSDNAWWMDVLEHGPASRYATFFDIDWSPQDPFLANKVLVPVLGDAYGAVLERGELRLAFEPDSGAFAVNYFDHRLPLDPRESATLVQLAAEAAHPHLAETAREALRVLVTDLQALPTRDDTDHAEERRRKAPECKARLAKLAKAHVPFHEAIDKAVERVNGTPGRIESFDALNTLLDTQAFRVAYWRVASDEINYRRFFDVNDLASLRMAGDDVFDATHAFLLELAADGRVGGFRIDHPDGLADPAWYFDRLQSRYRELITRGVSVDAQPGLYVVLEKISATHEHMPAQWRVQGDTGYPFANAMTGVLIDAMARSRIDRAWRAFVGDEAHDFGSAARAGKRAILRGSLAAGLNVLSNEALRIARSDPHTRDLTLNVLREALTEILAHFPVYRTYVTQNGASTQDRRYIDWAVASARGASRVADPSVFDFLRALLAAEPTMGDLPRSLVDRYVAFAMRFQQLSSPVAAKGVEDTAFYTHTRFVALNEVGGDPASFGLTRRAFHRMTADRAKAWPHTMLATSTHDNKRSEDVRARLAVISERPAQWRALMRRWRRLNRSRRTSVDGVFSPSRSDEYLLYQTLVGTFPEGASGAALETYRERIVDYMRKAAREAKTRTSWLRVDDAYEQSLASFIGAALTERADNRFLDELSREAQTFGWFGLLNSVTATLVKLTAPGVPDFYQGNEILDLSLVDPDNRRPVDYAKRRALLDSLDAIEREAGKPSSAPLRALFDDRDGLAKLWVAKRVLAFRRHHRALFDKGSYVPLTALGARNRHVLAFARVNGNEGVVVVAGRLFASLGLEPTQLPLAEELWQDTTLEPKAIPAGARISDVVSGTTFTFDGSPLSIARLFADFPGAVLSW
ncbi:MAG TPA: malto-oligosyltrehalose synthase [Casimicrobiaceae bacterium]|nr:malto-oligosyltrehalose synthase [Casimicrobiaceae bacterium]